MGIFGFGRKKTKEEVPEAVPETVGISRNVILTKKAGEYGAYYRMRLKFEENVATITV